MNPTSAMLLWGALTLVFLLVEALTPQLLCIWFAAGSVAALVIAAVGLEFWVQVVAWILVSAAMVALMRPLSKKFQQRTAEHLDATRILGRHAVVVESIDPDRGVGQVRVDRAIWSAKSASGEPLAAGVRVKVVKIEGVKAVVRLSRVQPEDEEKSE